LSKEICGVIRIDELHEGACTNNEARVAIKGRRNVSEGPVGKEGMHFLITGRGKGAGGGDSSKVDETRTLPSARNLGSCISGNIIVEHILGVLQLKRAGIHSVPRGNSKRMGKLHSL